MADYPTAIFPYCTRRNKSNQQVFTNYGCIEGADVSFSESNPVIVMKKIQSVSSEIPFGQRLNSIILEPSHDFLLLDKPEPIKHPLDDDIAVSRLFVKKFLRRRKYSSMPKAKALHTTPILEYMLNLSNDYPELTHGNFNRIIRDCCSSANFAKSKIAKRFHFHKFHKHIDPMLCSGGRRFLSETIREESWQEMRKKYCDRDYTGGSLVYQTLERSADGKTQWGALICAQSQGLDELSVKILKVNIDDENLTSQQWAVPNIKVVKEFRQSLNGTALQVDSVPFQQKNHFLIAARSNYHVLLSAFYGSSGAGSNCENSKTEDALSSLCCLRTSGHCKVSCIALSPFIVGECVVATEDGAVRLWNADRSNNSNGVSAENLHLVLNDQTCNNPWRQVCYGAHPRQFYIADESTVRLFDIRTRHNLMSLFDIKSSFHAKKSGNIYCISSSRNMANEYECLIGTNFSLFLMDQRFCREPLMQLGTSMTLPPCYIKAISVCETETVDTAWKWSNSASAVLLANQYPQEVHCYPFNKSKKTSIRCPAESTHFPIQCVGPPRILGSFASVRNYIRLHQSKHNCYLKNRTGKMTVGLDVIHSNNKRDGEGLIVLQMNSVGDIGYQTLQIKNIDAPWKTDSILSDETDETPTTSRSSQAEYRKLFRDEIKRNNYDTWIKAVANEDKVAVFKRSIVPFLKVPISCVRMSKLLTVNTGENLSSNCPLCLTPKLQNNVIFEKCSAAKCPMCGVKISTCISMNTVFGRKNGLITPTPNDVPDAADYHHESSDSEDNAEVENVLSLLKIENCEHDGNEIGILLQFTWSGTYGDYWMLQRQKEILQRSMEERDQNKLTFDLSDRSSELQLCSNQESKSPSSLKRRQKPDTAEHKSRETSTNFDWFSSRQSSSPKVRKVFGTRKRSSPNLPNEQSCSHISARIGSEHLDSQCVSPRKRAKRSLFASVGF